MATLKYRKSDGTFAALPAMAGPAGNGIANITQTSSSNDSGGSNVWTATMTNGTTATFTVKNGAQGAKGDKGDNYGDGVYLPLAGGTLSGQILCTETGTMWVFGRNKAPLKTTTSTNASSWQPIVSSKTQLGSWELGVCHPSEEFQFSYVPDTSYNNGSNDGTVQGVKITTAGVLQGAAWNDYAEFRQTKYPVKPGHVVYENGDDILSESYKRMLPACSIVSDTFGFAIGETEKCKTPLAQAGRVLAYPLENRNSYKPGDAVCSGPNGTVSKMTQDEKIAHPECIIGYVSCVPNYETWGEKDTKVDGRIWIKVI